MPSSRSRRGQGSLLLPIALTATAAVATVALYFWLGDDSPPQDQQRDSRGADDSRGTRAPRRRRFSHDRITEASEPESEVPVSRLRQQPSADLASKPCIAIVVTSGPEERPSLLLHHLPTPLSTARANIFVLVYAPKLRAHPLADGKVPASEGTVMNQARQLFAHDYPKEFVLPFTEKASVVPLLKQLAPQAVYIEAGLIGHEGEVIAGVLNGGWVGGVVMARTHGEPGVADIKGSWGKKLRVVDVGDVGDDWMAHVKE